MLLQTKSGRAFQTAAPDEEAAIYAGIAFDAAAHEALPLGCVVT